MKTALFVLITAVLIVAVAMVIITPRNVPAPVRQMKATIAAADGDCGAGYEAMPCAHVEWTRREPLPEVVRRVEPVLDDRARKAGIRGTVILDVGIRRDGSVGGVCVVKPLPCGLTDAAVAAVRQWRFAPPPRDVVSRVTITF